MTETEKLEMIKELVTKIKIPKIAYLPTNPNMRIIGIDINSGRPMQSAAKCPYLLNFYIEKIENIDILLK